MNLSDPNLSADPGTDPAPVSPPDLPEGREPSAITLALGLEGLLARIGEGAAARDLNLQLLHSEVAALKAEGIGKLRLPRALGGADLSLPEFFRVIRDIAWADSNLAHTLRNHFTVVERHRLTPDHPDSRRILALVAEGAIFGTANSDPGGDAAGAISFRHTSLTPVPDGQGQLLNSVKDYTTGNIYADQLIVLVPGRTPGSRAQVLIPATREGVSTTDDWTGFGQRLTGSGRTIFAGVHVPPGDFLAPDPRAEAYPGFYNFTWFQIYLTTVITGIAKRIFSDALALVRGRGRNYYHGLTEAVRDEPEIQSALGRIAALTHSAEAMADRAVVALDLAWAGIDGPDGRALSLAASMAASEAKIAVEENANTLANLLLDVASGSGLSRDRGLDRHWRNIRGLSAHNPRLYKERVTGAYYLNGTLPPTGVYF